MDNINKLIDLEANFEKDVEDILLENVKRRKNIKIIEECEMVDIYHRNNRCIGALFNKEGEALSVYAKVVILATGGIGGLYTKSPYCIFLKKIRGKKIFNF